MQRDQGDEIEGLKHRVAELEFQMRSVVDTTIPSWNQRVDKLSRTVNGSEDSDDLGLKGTVAETNKTMKEEVLPKVNQMYRALLMFMGGFLVIEIAMKFFVK